MKIYYNGGSYNGCVRKTKAKVSNGGGKAKARQHRFIPHGWGTFKFKDVSYTGFFRDGFEHGWGRVTWPNGDTYECYFRQGRPEAASLKLIKEAKQLRAQVSALKAIKKASSKLIKDSKQLRAQVSELKESLIESQDDLSLEQEKTMQMALALDREQGRCQALYNLALSVGIDAGQLNAILNND